MAKYLAAHDVEIVGDVPTSLHGRGRYLPIYELGYQHYVIEKNSIFLYFGKPWRKIARRAWTMSSSKAGETLTDYR